MPKFCVNRKRKTRSAADRTKLKGNSKRIFARNNSNGRKYAGAYAKLLICWVKISTGALGIGRIALWLISFRESVFVSRIFSRHLFLFFFFFKLSVSAVKHHLTRTNQKNFAGSARHLFSLSLSAHLSPSYRPHFSFVCNFRTGATLAAGNHSLLAHDAIYATWRCEQRTKTKNHYRSVCGS